MSRNGFVFVALWVVGALSCGPTPLGSNNNNNNDGGADSGVAALASDGSTGGTGSSDAADDAAGTGGAGTGGSAGTGGAAGTGPDCAPCAQFDHCCLLVSLDGCNKDASCVAAAAGAARDQVVTQCRASLQTLMSKLPPSFMVSCQQLIGGSDAGDAGASANDVGDANVTEAGDAGGASCPAQAPIPTPMACSMVGQLCSYHAFFCTCIAGAGAPTWSCSPII